MPNVEISHQNNLKIDNSRNITRRNFLKLGGIAIGTIASLYVIDSQSRETFEFNQQTLKDILSKTINDIETVLNITVNPSILDDIHIITNEAEYRTIAGISPDEPYQRVLDSLASTINNNIYLFAPSINADIIGETSNNAKIQRLQYILTHEILHYQAQSYETQQLVTEAFTNAKRLYPQLTPDIFTTFTGGTIIGAMIHTEGSDGLFYNDFYYVEEAETELLTRFVIDSVYETPNVDRPLYAEHVFLYNQLLNRLPGNKINTLRLLAYLRQIPCGREKWIEYIQDNLHIQGSTQYEAGLTVLQGIDLLDTDLLHEMLDE